MLKKLFFGLFAALSFFASPAFSQESCTTSTEHTCDNLTPSAWFIKECKPSDDGSGNSTTCAGPSFAKPSDSWRCEGTRTIKYGFNTSVQNFGTTAGCPSGFQMNQATGQCTKAAECTTPPVTCPSSNSTFMDNLEFTFDVPSGTSFSDLTQCTPQDPSKPSGSGCSLEFNGVFTPNPDGSMRFSGMSNATTAPCEYSPTPTADQLGAADYPPPPPETAKQPPAGTCPGEVNGEVVFMPCSFGPSTETIAVTKTRQNGTDTITDNLTGSTTCNASTCTFNVTNNSTSTSGGASSKTINGTATNDGSGSDGDGDSDQPGNCGAPGQPVCAVKVDEKGTPAASLGSSAFDGVNQAMAETGVEEIELFRFVRESEVLLPYSWTFQLPTGCSPYPMQGFGLTIDICEFQPTIHDLMSLLWAAAGIFGLISIFRSSFA